METEWWPSVETFFRNDLPQKFNRRLCSIFFYSWHVNVINKDERCLPSRWSKCIVSSNFLKLLTQ